MENIIGQSIGRYHILEQLGEGGMAIVYKAYDTHLDCYVAIKFIRTERLSPELAATALKRFEREAKSVAQLTHPYIVRVTDYGEYQNIPYLVMPYLSGGTLKQLTGKSIPYYEAARLLSPIARALEYAHSQKVLHRDVKPTNILITQNGQPMLTDFGVAKILDIEDGQTLTGAGMGVGTPEYMAPEQALGQSVDGRVDVYALGVVFYELITGRKPYQADTPMAVIVKQIHDPLPRPTDYVNDLPDEVERVILKALAKKTEDRFHDMGVFAERLEALASKISSKGKQEKISDKTLDSITLTHPLSTTKSGSKSNRKYWKWLLLPLFFLIVFATVICLMHSNRPENQALIATEQLKSAASTATLENTPAPALENTPKNTINPTNAGASLVWNFDSVPNFDQWGNRSDIKDYALKNGALTFHTTGSDPHFYSPCCQKINAEDVNTIEIGMKTSKGEHGSIYWQSDVFKKNWDLNVVNFQIVPDNDFHTYEISTLGLVFWQGEITRFDFHIPQVEDADVAIDYIRFSWK